MSDQQQKTLDPLNPEGLARALEMHPDYRVLRRLVPRLDYGPQWVEEGHDEGVKYVLVLDTETTGLTQADNKIIELAMLLLQVDVASGLPFGAVEVYEGFEDPGMPIPEEAKKVTGITDEMVRGQRLNEDLIRKMVQMADVVVAHNAGFDRPFVEARLPFFANARWACSIKDIDWKASGAASASLVSLAGDCGLFYEAHRAQVDCHALVQVLSWPIAPGMLTGFSLLLQAANSQSYEVAATGSPFESKDKLKARGYRWDAPNKVWVATVADEQALNDECIWLREQVYGTRPARVNVSKIDGHTRYSSRLGELSMRSL